MQPAASLQVGLSSDVRQRALLDLADQLLYEPCYDTLRTKEQLGYTVSSGSRLTHGVLGFCVVVVSAKYGAQVGKLLMAGDAPAAAQAEQAVNEGSSSGRAAAAGPQRASCRCRAELRCMLG
jgi:secreted Zn-dependent insulinase-like peptidase